MTCEYTVYALKEGADVGKLATSSDLLTAFDPIYCDEDAVETVLKRSRRHPDLERELRVCADHARELRFENELDDAIAEGAFGREIWSQINQKCTCRGHAHVGEFCPRPCGCAVAP